MDDYNLQNKQQYGFVLITHYYVPFIPSSVDACYRKSHLSYQWIMLLSYVNHNPYMHHVSYWGQGFLPCVFIRAPDVERRHYCRWGSHCASNQIGYDSMTPFFPNRERQLLISPHPTLLLQHWFFRHERHYKDIFCYCGFLDMCVPHVHFTSNK
jgi:hypothetical protein